ncbi:hypothetical protein J2Y59_001868 [Arcicella sp. BE139]|nr:hypothetical protein [Arcicella sp. BE139]
MQSLASSERRLLQGFQPNLFHKSKTHFNKVAVTLAVTILWLEAL